MKVVPRRQVKRHSALAESSPSQIKRQSAASSRIRTSQELGLLVRRSRHAQGLLQQDVIGIANVGNRFISELENGKPTLQLQKVLDVLDILGLEVVVQRKGVREVLA